MALWPEKIEEEGSTENGGDEDADEDVERSDADEVVVMNVGGGELGLHESLLIDIVCEVLVDVCAKL
jgi:hypothetical protein